MTILLKNCPTIRKIYQRFGLLPEVRPSVRAYQRFGFGQRSGILARPEVRLGRRTKIHLRFNTGNMLLP